jgi:uncharacterized protein (TIGR03437 family)
LMRLGGRIAGLLLGLTAFAAVGSAYYHFLHFNTRVSTSRGLPEKFDLNALPNKTLTYFVSDQSELQFAPADTYAGLVSQIRAAAQTWSDVETSDLRLAFGGMSAPETQQTSPSLKVLFEEMPPGTVAMGGPTIKADANDSFIPILQSVVKLSPDLTRRPSYTEQFFGTLVHEFGHALGLQHTLTSSVMSTATTRATSKARPLSADDIAAISLLYPKPSFFASTGIIAGRVTLNGGPLNLASVVGISPSGAAVSALTNPDGSYRIEGLPPRQYLVYVHPLPPAPLGKSTAADIVYPVDADGQSLAPGPAFDTVFFPGTNDSQRAFPLTVTAGTTIENVNFTVRQRSALAVHSVETYSFPGTSAVKPPYLSPASNRPFIVAYGAGLVSGNAPASGLSATVLGGASLPARPYSSRPDAYIQLDVDVRTLTFSADAPKHLIFSLNDDIYVLPSAYFHVERMPPAIDAVAPLAENGTRLAVVTGSNLTAQTRILFDGALARTRQFDEATGALIVVPPPAAAGHRANVVALNPDGQSSLFLQSEQPPSYIYGPDPFSPAGASLLAATPGAVSPGTEALIQIDATNVAFAEGQTAVGFGNSDIVVKRVWVRGPNRLVANVAVSPAAQPGPVHITVASGLQVAKQEAAFQVAQPNPAGFWLRSDVLNAATGQTLLTPGATAVLTVGGTPLPLAANGLILSLNESPVPVLGVTGNQVTFQIPAGTAPGLAILRLDYQGARSHSIAAAISDPVPQIVRVTLGFTDKPADAANPARAGDLLMITVRNLAGIGAPVEASRIRITIGGIEIGVAQLVQGPDSTGLLVVVPPNAPTGIDVPVSVTLDGRTSEAFRVAVRP